MKLRVMSDLHLEWHRKYGNRDDGLKFMMDLGEGLDEVLVLAGDISSSSMILPVLQFLCQSFWHVVYVCGNHEYYASTWGTVEKKLRHFARKYDNFHWLNNSSCEIDGKWFHGGTLWYPESIEAGYRKYSFSDFAYIKNIEPTVYRRRAAAVRHFRSHIKPGDVVVTHHAPSYQSVAERFQGDEFNCFFANNLDSLIVDTRPALWIHGHMHDSLNYKIEETTILVNPYGYVDHEVNPNFNKNLVVEY